ncbi:hypothetical protein PCE1_001518 [Barthelona sp. PCE]
MSAWRTVGIFVIIACLAAALYLACTSKAVRKRMSANDEPKPPVEVVANPQAIGGELYNPAIPMKTKQAPSAPTDPASNNDVYLTYVNN